MNESGRSARKGKAKMDPQVLRHCHDATRSIAKMDSFFFYYSYAPFTSRFNPFGRVFNNNEVGSIREKNRNIVVVQAPLGDSSTVQLKRY